MFKPNIVSLVKLEMDEGIVEFRRLDENIKRDTLRRLEMDSGISPCKRFSEKSNQTNLVRWDPIDDGIVPLNLLLEKSSNSIDDKAERSDGRVPVSSLNSKPNVARFVMFR